MPEMLRNVNNYYHVDNNNYANNVHHRDNEHDPNHQHHGDNNNHVSSNEF